MLLYRYGAWGTFFQHVRTCSKNPRPLRCYHAKDDAEARSLMPSMSGISLALEIHVSTTQTLHQCSASRQVIVPLPSIQASVSRLLFRNQVSIKSCKHAPGPAPRTRQHHPPPEQIRTHARKLPPAAPCKPYGPRFQRPTCPSASPAASAVQGRRRARKGAWPRHRVVPRAGN